jgi:hypothetical protein
MPLGLICTCGARFDVDDTFAGREVVCPECQTTLHAPAGGPPPARTSLLAIVSVVLALSGALTIVGSAAGAIVGMIAAYQIWGDRQRQTGLSFALAGIILGVGFTVLTTLILAGGYLNGLDGRYREALFADQIDTSGPLDIRRADKGFTLRKPAADWGIARRNKVDDPHVDGLRFGKDPDLLLLQPARFLFVDVRKETRSGELTAQDLDKRYCERVNHLVNYGRERDHQGQFNMWNGRPQQWPPGRGAFPPDEDQLDPEDPIDPARPGLKPTFVDPHDRHGIPVRDDKNNDLAGSGYESVLDIKIGTQRWTVILRHYRKGDSIYVVRGYTQKSRFPAGEAELRQCLDSFRLLP